GVRASAALLASAEVNASRFPCSSLSRSRQFGPRCFRSPFPHSAIRMRSAAVTASRAAATASDGCDVNKATEQTLSEGAAGGLGSSADVPYCHFCGTQRSGKYLIFLAI